MPDLDEDRDYTDYAAGALPWLRRFAYLLCQDWHRADDLVQTTATQLYVHWKRAARVENLDAYTRKILVNTYLAEQRTSWLKRVTPQSDAGDGPAAESDLDAAMDVRRALAALPPRQRAAVVLRYYGGLSVDETAAALGCSNTNVRSQTSRGLATLRVGLEQSPVSTA